MTEEKSSSPRGFIFLSIFVMLLAFHSCKQKEPEPILKERLAYVSEGTIHVKGLKDNTYTKAGPGREPSISYDGRYLAYVSSVGNKQRISILDFPNRNTNVIEDVQGTSWHPVWSPTENRFLFSARVGDESTSFRVAIVGHVLEEQKYVIAREGVNILSPAWGPDGESVYAHDTQYLYQFEKTGMLISHEILEQKFGSLDFNQSTLILPSTDGNHWLIGIGAEEPAGRPRKTSFTLFLFDGLNHTLTQVSTEDMFIADFNWSCDNHGVIFTGKKTAGQGQTDIFLLSLTDNSITRLAKNASQPSCRSIQVLTPESQE